ncbi:MAG: HNH endonuclease [Saprospiraceae bacterium]|nr:HNH endonuclease [Saprospiraceae bacterium]
MSYISKNTRRLVIKRGGNRCEYCRVLDYLGGFDYHIEHIIGVQHGGTDALSNLAYACSYCNWKKGPNISTILDGELTPLFNPRTQNWFDHFEVERGKILPLSTVGAATIKLLDLNQSARVDARFEMMLAGCYP